MDWNKWIIERLPRRLRVVGMFALCVVLTSYIKQLHDEFVEWRRRLRIRMAGTPQVCQLKKIVHDEIGLDIQIEEGNGKPIDFIIKTSFVDIDKERRLFALLDRYKLAGKSYGYENAEIALTAIWSRFVCEKMDLHVYWSRFACEQFNVSLQWTGWTCEKVFKKDVNRIYCWHASNSVFARAEFAPTSEIRVTFEYSGYDMDTGAILHKQTVIIPKGVTTTQSALWAWPSELPFVAHLNINEDETYQYKEVWQ